MRTQDCLTIIAALFIGVSLGCQSVQTATISATMKANLNTNVASYQLKIQKIILCDGYGKYMALGEISKLPKEEVKGPILEDSVTFVGPIKPIQYFLILNKQVRQELQNHLDPHPYQVVESEAEMRGLKGLQPQRTGAAAASEKGRTSVGDCKIFFIRQ